MNAYFLGNYGLEIELTEEESTIGSHAGECDEDVRYLLETDHIANQFESIDPSLIAMELKEYGAWDEEELKDEKLNRERILWIACGYVKEMRRRREMDYNAFFTPATKHTGKFRGLYIVYKEVQKTYYASYNGSSESVKYALCKVARKKGDLLISDRYDRIRMHDAYIFTSNKAIENWPLWDEVLGYKPLDKIELLQLLDVVI